MKKHIKIFLPQIILILIVILIGFLNYKPLTFFIGWDNFHSEFYPLLNLKRTIFTTWQEYQSLGLLGGMGHGAEFSRQLILYIFGVYKLPQNLIRYFTNFSMLAIGVIGVYQLTQTTFYRSFDSKSRRCAAFFASLFYMLNWGTIQVFYAPFETFTSFFASLPWLILATLLYLQYQTRNRYLFLSVILFLSASSFYIQTHFVVFGIVSILLFINHLIVDNHQNLTTKIKSWLIIGLTIIGTQAHWLFPVAIFSLNNSQTTINAAQNQVATPDVIARNTEYGNLTDVIKLKGFWYDYADTQSNNQMGIMMDAWSTHTESTTVLLISYLLFFVVLFGLIYSFKRKLPYRHFFATLFLVAIFFLINRNFPTGYIYSFIENHVPIFAQFFRSVFTKWISVASLSFSVLFGVGVVFIVDLFTNISTKSSLTLTSVTALLLIFIYSSPSFQGLFIYPQMRQSLPSEYLQLFDYFKKQDASTRIANMPQHTFWGWYQTDWGYRGSGFIWYGIEQPILDRAFDVWSKPSQDYYFEIRHAIYSQNRSLLEALLEKYAVNWILIDNSVIIPGSTNQKGLYLSEIKSMLKNSQKITKETSIGFLDIYKVDLATKPTNFIDTTSYKGTQINLPPVSDPLPQDIISTASQLPSLQNKPTNCDNFNSTAFDRIYTGDEITYTATNAMSCDHLIYSSLPHSYGYNFTISHKNNSGQPFLVCIESHVSGQCEYFGYLPQSKDWKDTKLTINRLKSGDYGFTVHLYNYSIGRIPVSNSLKQITIEPIWSQIPDTTPTNSLPYAKIISSTKHDYTFYETTIAPSSDSQLLTLNQAYDTGWKAYTFNDVPRLPTILRYLFSITGVPLQEKNHIKNKGWENTWIIPSGTKHIVIIYVPQIIQYIGFALLILPIPLVLLHKTKKAPEEGR